MRKEASLKQWKVLYENAGRIKEMKPWEKFRDMDLIAIQRGDEEDTVFCSILGHGGECYGVAVYEGIEGLNSFWLLADQKVLNIDGDYAIFNQKNLTCRWGNKEEMAEPQLKIVQDLGYQFEGENEWLYFLSFEPGYVPYNMDEAEVLEMSCYLEDLAMVLKSYEERNMEVDFQHGKMFLATYDEEENEWSFQEDELPFTQYQIVNFLIDEEEMISDLRNSSKCDEILEADVSVVGSVVEDECYERPAYPMFSLLGNVEKGVRVNYEILEPDEDAVMVLAGMLVEYIGTNGAPKEVHVSNPMVEAGIRQICNEAGILIRRVTNLPKLENFKRGMRLFL